MGNWELEIAFHWPHNRFALGWEFVRADKEYDFATFKLYMFCVTFTLDV